MDAIEKYNNWLNNDFIDEEDKKILKNMNNEEIHESFNDDLKFGTAGIRGIMGLGTGKFNKYTIGKVTVGLANYLNKHFENPSVVIAYDTRLNSDKYALDTSLILNYYGIKTYLFNEYTSTPELSFSVKYLNCSCGIVITSSHNAKIYNGYKVYNNKGGQIVPPEDDLVIKEVNNVTDLKNIKMAPKNNELFNITPSEVHKMFLLENKKAILNEELIKKYSKDITITYTSMHGVGIKTMEELFNDYNINYNIVKEQCTYDSNFTTAPEPNPEIEDNFKLSIKYAKENNSDLIVASDPDADRMGAMIKINDEYKLLNGNLIGILFTYYVVTNSKLNKNNYIVRSLPSSEMVDSIANKYNINVKTVLTGCKNIAYEKNIDPINYVFGYEESLGYVFNIDVNDKNSFSSALSLIEILCYCKSKNISINDYIEKMYEEIGYFYDYTTSNTFDGVDGMSKMDEFMNKLRKDEIKFDNVILKEDYINRNDRLKTNAIKYRFNDNSYLTIRPSGTEPKIKLYFGSYNKDKNKSLESLNKLKENVYKVIHKE